MKPLLAIYLFLSILSLSLTANKPDKPAYGRFDFTSGLEQVEIPFYTFNNQVILSVTVNEKIPLNFILDTGTSQVIFFDRKLAHQIGIGLGRKIQFSGVGKNHSVTAFRSRGVKLELPGVVGEGMGMAVLSQDYLDMKRFDIHGVIGYQLFTRFAVKIDYQRRILTLMEPERYSTSGFQALDLQIQNSRPYIQSGICFGNNSEIRLTLMIDTGAAYDLSLITGTHPAIRSPKKSTKALLANGLGGDIMGTKGPATLKLNAMLTSEVEAFYIKPRDYSHKGTDRYKMGAIGSRLLRNYIVILDYSNSRMLVQIQDTSIQVQNKKT